MSPEEVLKQHQWDPAVCDTVCGCGEYTDDLPAHQLAALRGWGYAVIALPDPDVVGSDGYHYWDNHDVHCHPGDGVGYVCINKPADEWTAAEMRSWAASLLAAADVAESVGVLPEQEKP